MAFPRLSAVMLLPSFILLLYWTTSSARSHDPTSLDRPTGLPFEARPKVEYVLGFVNNFLTAAKEGIEGIDDTDTRKLATMMKSLTNVASWAPGIGGLVASFVNMVLIFIPQHDPVLNEVKKGFEEVNRRLDSLSIQISNLATDVEWFNYASIYSQDEVRILNAWKKFDEFLKNSQSLLSQDEKLRLAEIFVNYYENTATEASVANLYHYLTVSDTSLSGNLNNLLRKKFKCGVYEISKYNLYFSTLLWKGMVLNQLYWKLIGFNQIGIETKHEQMFKTVYTTQISAINSCLNDYETYLQKDVDEVSKALSPDNKTVVAEAVKTFLDKKYFWYNWVVLVYNNDDKKNYILLNPTFMLTMSTITVTVGYTLKAPFHEYQQQVARVADKCFADMTCDKITQAQTNICQFTWSYDFDTLGIPHDIDFIKYFKAMHVTYGSEFAEVPKPAHQYQCTWGRSTSTMSIYNSRSFSVCYPDPCRNNGRCRRLMDTNESVCDCSEGYYGNTCEKIIDTTSVAVPEIHHVPDISTIDGKLKTMEYKLSEILIIINERCPRQ